MAAFDRESVLIYEDEVSGWYDKAIATLDTNGFGELTFDVEVICTRESGREYPLIVLIGEIGFEGETSEDYLIGETYLVPLAAGWEWSIVTIKPKRITNPMTINLIDLGYSSGHLVRVTAHVQYLSDDATPIPPLEREPDPQ